MLVSSFGGLDAFGVDVSCLTTADVVPETALVEEVAAHLHSTTRMAHLHVNLHGEEVVALSWGNIADATLLVAPKAAVLGLSNLPLAHVGLDLPALARAFHMLRTSTSLGVTSLVCLWLPLAESEAPLRSRLSV